MPGFVKNRDRKEILDYFAHRFGIPEERFQPYELFERGKMIRIISTSPQLEEAMRSLKVERVGIPFLRRKRPIWKPTTVGLQIFGSGATRNVMDLDREAFELLFGGEPLHQALPFEPGYVILRWKGGVLGCGFYDKGVLESQIPRSGTKVKKE